MVCTFLFSIFGWEHVWYASLGDFYVRCFYSHFIASAEIIQYVWPSRIPAPLFLMTYILSAVMCFCIAVMAGHHMYQVAKAETSVEGEEFVYLRKECQKRGRVCLSVSLRLVGWCIFMSCRPSRMLFTSEGRRTYNFSLTSVQAHSTSSSVY